MSKTFKIMQTQENTLMIVDALNLAFRYKHSGATDFAEDYLRTVVSLQRSYRATKVIIAADQGSSQYRKQLYPDYKQNRKDKFAEQTEVEKAQFELFFEDFQKTLEYIQENTSFPVVRFQGVEADDIAAYIVTKRKHLSTDTVWLVSSDKDWDLLVQPNISRFSYVTRKETTWENWRTHYDFEPDDYISIKCLMGDSGDNVPGVHGIGPKRALALVEQFGSVYDIIASLPIGGKYKYLEALNQSGDQLLLNYKLMDLMSYCHEALGPQNCEHIDQIIETYVNQ